MRLNKVFGRGVERQVRHGGRNPGDAVPKDVRAPEVARRNEPNNSTLNWTFAFSVLTEERTLFKSTKLVLTFATNFPFPAHNSLYVAFLSTAQGSQLPDYRPPKVNTPPPSPHSPCETVRAGHINQCVTCPATGKRSSSARQQGQNKRHLSLLKGHLSRFKVI
jgi:hypothetical protein